MLNVGLSRRRYVCGLLYERIGWTPERLTTFGGIEVEETRPPKKQGR